MDVKSLKASLAGLAPVIGKGGVEAIVEIAGRRDGWDNGKGRKLQTPSLRMLLEVGESLPPLTRGLNVLLTRDGNLSLSFEDAQGQSVELDFLPDGFYLYSEQLGGQERELERSERGELLKLLRGLV